MRLIDADALIKDHQYNGYHTPGQEDPMVVDVADIEDAPAIAPPDWTPCAEGLPEESGRYRVTVERFFNGKASRFVSDREFFKYLSAGSRWESCVISENVLAWKPEDKPYNPDHIRDTTKKVDHPVDPNKKIEEATNE